MRATRLRSESISALADCSFAASSSGAPPAGCSAISPWRTRTRSVAAFQCSTRRCSSSRHFLRWSKSADRRDLRRLLAFGARGDLEGNLLVLLERLEARAALDLGEMREQVLAAAVRGDEAVALGVVEPLDRACAHVCLPW